jgi:methyl-accepting chemotaxis protein
MTPENQERLIEAFERIAARMPDSEALRTDHPLQSETFGGLVNGLNEIAGAISGAGQDTREGLTAVAESLDSVATHLKYLGVGNAGTTMGAVEFLAVKTKEGLSEVASALDNLAEIAEPGQRASRDRVESWTETAEDIARQEACLPNTNGDAPEEST